MTKSAEESSESAREVMDISVLEAMEGLGCRGSHTGVQDSSGGYEVLTWGSGAVSIHPQILLHIQHV